MGSPEPPASPAAWGGPDPEDDCPICGMMSVVDHYKESLDNGAYVYMCGELKRLHGLKKLFIVKYWEMVVEEAIDDDEHTVTHRYVNFRAKSRIFWESLDGDSCHSWDRAFTTNVLPMNRRNCAVNSPFMRDNTALIVHSIVPYLKRGRERDLAEVGAHPFDRNVA